MGSEAPKRINRSNDRQTYQPRLHQDRIHQLYELGQELKLPMTVVLDQAIEFYVSQLYDGDNTNQLRPKDLA